MTGFRRYQRLQPRHIVLVQSIQSPSQDIIIKMFRSDAGSQQPLDWLIGLKGRCQIQRPVHKPQAIQHHSLNRLAHRNQTLSSVLDDHPIEYLTNP